jgi:hypothetical protein
MYPYNEDTPDRLQGWVHARVRHIAMPAVVKVAELAPHLSRRCPQLVRYRLL